MAAVRFSPLERRRKASPACDRTAAYAYYYYYTAGRAETG